jgi:hypothetical protein
MYKNRPGMRYGVEVEFVLIEAGRRESDANGAGPLNA